MLLNKTNLHSISLTRTLHIAAYLDVVDLDLDLQKLQEASTDLGVGLQKAFGQTCCLTEKKYINC